MISNLKRKNEITKELSNSIYKKIKSEFFNDIASGNLKTAGILSETIIEAINLIDTKYLTPVSYTHLDVYKRQS